jgi:membrane-bound lytic murein transglycosylase B
MRLRKLAAVFACVAIATGAIAEVDSYAKRPDVDDYVDALVRDHAFSRSELLELFAQTRRNERVLELIARPAERRLEWHEYREILVDEPRIDLGVQFWNDNAETLARAESVYGVAAEYLVAIIGVETRYGKIKGSYPVLDALTTLGFDYPPRASFFKSELTQFLLLARDEGRDPRSLTGSYAGAMGYGQFIPSSYRSYAVDFDGDGLRDIWNNRIDAIGSVANYFSRHGWKGNSDVVVLAAVDDDALAAEANASFKPNVAVEELRGKGVRADLPDEARVAVFRLIGDNGPEYWLGLNDFYVITRYNRSSMYALAVHQLSQAIKARRQESDS